jgi:hypothetical protein
MQASRRPVLTSVGEMVGALVGGSVGKYVGSSVKVVRFAKKMFRRCANRANIISDKIK